MTKIIDDQVYKRRNAVQSVTNATEMPANVLKVRQLQGNKAHKNSQKYAFTEETIRNVNSPDGRGDSMNGKISQQQQQYMQKHG